MAISKKLISAGKVVLPVLVGAVGTGIVAKVVTPHIPAAVKNKAMAINGTATVGGLLGVAFGKGAIRQGSIGAAVFGGTALVAGLMAKTAGAVSTASNTPPPLPDATAIA